MALENPKEVDQTLKSRGERAVAPLLGHPRNILYCCVDALPRVPYLEVCGN